MQTTFGSVNHGAGRTMSRFGAKKKLKNVDVRGELAAKGITVMASGDIRDEAPQAYKDIDAVIDVDVRAGIGKLVARMVPIAVMKG
jgi:tRNA-splicing ligase RtcB